MVRWRRGLLGGVLVALAVLLIACGGGDDKAGGTGDFSGEVAAQQAAVAADPSGALKWDRGSYEAPAGDITFVVTNSSPVAHQFSIEGNGVTPTKAPTSGRTRPICTP